MDIGQRGGAAPDVGKWMRDGVRFEQEDGVRRRAWRALGQRGSDARREYT